MGQIKKTEILIHIGYHKTSTTWFQKFLFTNSAIGFILPWRNPEILSVLVYPHALDFVPYTCKTYFKPAIHEAQNCGLIPVLSSEELSGNPHSGGYASKELANRLAIVFPKAKVLIVIREQKGMIVSTYKQYVKVGGTCSLAAYLQPPTRGKQRIPLFDWDHFKYHRLIKYYQGLFGHSRVLTLPYELFRDHPSDFFVSQIMLFCGLEIEAKTIEVLPYSTRENRSLSGISVALKRYVNRIVSPRDRLNLHAPISITPPIHRKLYACWQTLDSAIPSLFKEVSDKRIEMLACKLIGDRYKQSNALTAEMLNVNLGQYGYDLERCL